MDLGTFFQFCSMLHEAGLRYSLTVSRPQTVMVTFRTPGNHWEIEFMPDGEILLERYVTDGGVVETSLTGLRDVIDEYWHGTAVSDEFQHFGDEQTAHESKLEEPTTHEMADDHP
jgi:hypothetical protein